MEKIEINSFDGAVKIRKELKKFWRNYKIISSKTDEKNESKGNCFSWQHYFGGKGMSEYNIFPEITNANIISWLIGDTNSKLYPSEEDQYNFKVVLNYEKK